MLPRADVLAEPLHLPARASQCQQVGRGRKVRFGGQPVSVLVVRCGHSQPHCRPVHFRHEPPKWIGGAFGSFISGRTEPLAKMFAQCHRGVVSGRKHQAVEQFADGKPFARSDPCRGTARSIGSLTEDDLLVQHGRIGLGQLQHDDGGHDLRRTRKMQFPPGIVLPQHLSGHSISNRPRAAGDTGWPVERIGWTAVEFLSVDH